MKKGITFAGNLIVDYIKNIDTYPKCGMLANITSVSRAVGGSLPNTAINLAKIDPSVPLSAVGRVGKDENGEYVVAKLKEFGIDTSRVTVSDAAPTSFTDVMNAPGERTFFQARGANAEFAPEHIDIDALDCDILHIGYILLLDIFDMDDEDYGTVMARFLNDVQKKGIKTSIDVVSDSSADYMKKIAPALKYCDYAIMNEIESSSIWHMDPRNPDGTINADTIHEVMKKMAELGVKEKIIIHAKEAGFILDVKTGAFCAVPSLKIDKSLIKGSTGAGDTFCAGSLYGLYTGMSDKEILEFASTAAARNLFSENSIDGMVEKAELIKMMEETERLPL